MCVCDLYFGGSHARASKKGYKHKYFYACLLVSYHKYMTRLLRLIVHFRGGDYYSPMAIWPDAIVIWKDSNSLGSHPLTLSALTITTVTSTACLVYRQQRAFELAKIYNRQHA